MKYGTIPGIPKKISRLVQGVMWLKRDDPQTSFAVLDRLLEARCNTFDTAHIYGPNCEGVLGDWINVRNNREEVVILEKGCHPMGGKKRVDPASLASDISESMERIRTDYFDLYILHRDDPDMPVGEIVSALNDEVKKGRIKAFGGSNWFVERLQAANDYAAVNGLIPMAASSPCFNLVDQHQAPWPGCISIGGPYRTAERQWYKEHNMPVFGWSSLAGGFLTGKYGRENRADGDDRTKFIMGSYGTDGNFDILDRVKEMADRKNVSMAQIAVAYTLNTGLDAYALTGCATMADAEDNLRAVDLELTEDDVAFLERKPQLVG